MQRLFFIFLGFCAAYFAVYLGDGVYGQIPVKNPTQDQVLLVLVIGVIGIIGCFAWALVAYHLVDYWNSVFEDEYAGPTLAVSLAAIGFAFGALAGPFANYGPYPWFWASRWAFFPATVVLTTIPFIAYSVRQLVRS